MKKVYCDRSRHQDHARCPRLRFLGYHSGTQQLGLQPVRKSIHLVLGGAVHSGLEVLLREGGSIISDVMRLDNPLDVALQQLFESPAARTIEDRAVVAALADLTAATAHGVELDDQERLDMAAAAAGQAASGGNPAVTGDTAMAPTLSEPIIDISFNDWDAASGKFIDLKVDPTSVVVGLPDPLTPQTDMGAVIVRSPSAPQATTSLDWSAPVYLEPRKHGPDPAKAAGADASAAASSQGQSASDLALLDTIQIQRADAEQAATTGIDSYLREELAAQVEAMVRAYSRRRLRPLLESHEVLEIEREGEWQLGQVCSVCGDSLPDSATKDYDCSCKDRGASFCSPVELRFMSRHDALLLERQTGFLYLQSYKTTGSWDRRKETDAQVDMQGLSEAVDVEKRLGEAWRLLQAERYPEVSDALDAQIAELVNERTMLWLSGLPEPPKILGVRYEYLLKGPRRKDKKDLQQPGRYVADTPLIRAYKQDGLTADDRRWAPTYEWFDPAGKSRRLDYRSWAKAPVWKYMTVAAWIDLLDRGEVQADCYDENGVALDVLAEQFVTPVTVYRSEDSMRDMLESLEATEQRIAVDVAAVQAVAGEPARLRSELNRRFPQALRACSYPGKCAYWECCHGPAAIRENMETSGLFAARVPNHLQELEGRNA